MFFSTVNLQTYITIYTIFVLFIYKVQSKELTYSIHSDMYRRKTPFGGIYLNLLNHIKQLTMMQLTHGTIIFIIK